MAATVPPPQVQEQILPAAWRDALLYPFRGNGPMFLVAGALLFSVIWLGAGAVPFGFIFILAAQFYIAAYLWQVIEDSAAGKAELPDWPLMARFEEVLPPGWNFVVVSFVCFGPGMLIQLFLPQYAWAGWALLICGAAYLPMALLAVCLFDSFAGLDPRVVLPAIGQVPGPYAIVCLGTAAALGLSASGQWLTVNLGWFGLPLAMLMTLYAMIVQMRLIGSLYHRHSSQIGWFDTDVGEARDKGGVGA